MALRNEVVSEETASRGNALLTRVSRAWQAATVELEEVAETPDGRVLAVERWRMTGRDGIEIDAYCTDVYSFRDGLICEYRGVYDLGQMDMKPS